MSDERAIYKYQKIKKVAERLKSDLDNINFVILYAYNGIGKTRLSMEFKDLVKHKQSGIAGTLYFNAYTEDLFSWHNDLDADNERFLKINQESKFVRAFQELALEDKIREYYGRYTDIGFSIDYTRWQVRFSRTYPTKERRDGEYIDTIKTDSDIKTSRGEETIFIWCLFLAICRLAIDGDEAYSWVKYIYIDDPISSLDDNNAIMVACDLVRLLKEAAEKEIKIIISSHHSLFFNVLCNELKTSRHKKYFLHYQRNEQKYILQTTGDTPFFHHVAALHELKQASDSGKLYTHHFNMLRNIMEKTASFFGHDDFSMCLKGIQDENMYARALNLLSHGNYSLFEQREMVHDNKQLFRIVFDDFLSKYGFNLPNMSGQ